MLRSDEFIICFAWVILETEKILAIFRQIILDVARQEVNRFSLLATLRRVKRKIQWHFASMLISVIFQIGEVLFIRLCKQEM